MSIDMSNWLSDAPMLVLFVMSVLIFVIVWSWHRDSRNGFRLEQLLIDSVTKKVAIEKVGYMTALAISTWGFITLILRGQMTEWYFIGFVGVFAAARTASMGISVLKDIKKPTKVEDETQT